ncbi:PadR family transcriptional regulator [Rugamonas sp. CCM 8940]|uniref:PadR family transcriptional regulator n=1 Tax=Rugamonas sp. CCM 8940 TaxID=2765359 RepID=UPI0018F3DEE6|nr:PadR family transcriptional regulator [Rugamonas sp. CCM 8940]MBJ7313682.1 PadR family transcriptional regulator [Rugamonas sp. CCM 8940]
MFRFLHSSHRFHHMHGRHHGGGGRGPKMFDAGAMRYIVLQLISEKPRHGYEIIKELEQRAGGSYTPSPGAIYPLLSMLLDMGHVSATPDGNKKLHTITPEGSIFLAENRQFVDAIMARMNEPAGGHGDVRGSMHALKVAVIQQVRENQPDEAKLAQIQAILRRATVEIEQL